MQPGGKTPKRKGSDAAEQKFLEYCDMKMNHGGSKVLDGDEMFCMSLASSLKKLPEEKRELAKFKLQEVIFQLQFPNQMQAPQMQQLANPMQQQNQMPFGEAGAMLLLMMDNQFQNL